MLIAILFGIFIPISLASCPAGSIQGSDADDCYQIFAQPTNWVTAEEICVRNGGHLASISNAFQNAFLLTEVQSLLFNADGAWIGGNTIIATGNWSWSDNSSFIYTNWEKGQPTGNKEKCASINCVSGKWYSQDCLSQNLPYICKVNATQAYAPCPDGYIYYKETNFCYKHYNETVNFTIAESVCNEDGGSSVSIHSYAENSFLGTYFGRPSGSDTIWVWIGLIYVNGSWVWTDNTQTDYINWFPNKPYADEDFPCAWINLSSTSGNSTQWCNGVCDSIPDGVICKVPSIN